MSPAARRKVPATPAVASAVDLWPADTTPVPFPATTDPVRRVPTSLPAPASAGRSSTPSPARSRRHPATRSATSCCPAATAVPRSATRRPVPPACSSCGRPVAAAVRRRRSPARSHSSVTSSVRSCATAVAIAAVAAAATVIIRSARRSVISRSPVGDTCVCCPVMRVNVRRVL